MPQRKPRPMFGVNVMVTEAVTQKEVARWLDMRGHLWCHVPNGGKRSVRTAAALKAQGVKRGVPDILVFHRPPRAPQCIGAALELKREGTNRVSDEQRTWLAALADLGWAVFAAEGSDVAIGWLAELGY
jgi:hypothetical protein